MALLSAVDRVNEREAHTVAKRSYDMPNYEAEN